MLPWRKTRTRLGAWMDRKRVSQEWLSKETGISRNTMTELCGNVEYRPRNTTKSDVIKALRKIDGDVRVSDFW